MALPVALAVLFTTAGLATVAAKAGMVSSGQGFRDTIRQARLPGGQRRHPRRDLPTNLLQPGPNECVLKDGAEALSKGAVQSNGWCAPQVEDLGEGGSYSMRVSQGDDRDGLRPGLFPPVDRQRRHGNGITRRTVVDVNAATGAPIFPVNYAIVGRDSLEFKNNLDVLNGGLGSNGNITIKNNATVCGTRDPGAGPAVDPGQQQRVLRVHTGARRPALRLPARRPVERVGRRTTTSGSPT